MSFRSLRRRLEDNSRFRELMDAQFPYRRVASAIVGIRAELGLTQTDLAERAGTSQPVIARLESGRHAVRVDLLNRIANSVGMTWEPVFRPERVPEQPVLRETRTGDWVIRTLAHEPVVTHLIRVENPEPVGAPAFTKAFLGTTRTAETAGNRAVRVAAGR